MVVTSGVLCKLDISISHLFVLCDVKTISDLTDPRIQEVLT